MKNIFSITIVALALVSTSAFATPTCPPGQVKKGWKCVDAPTTPTSADADATAIAGAAAGANANANNRNSNDNSGNSSIVIGGGSDQGGSTLSPTSNSNSTATTGDATATSGDSSATGVAGDVLASGAIVINNGLSEDEARDLAAPDDNSVNITDNSVYEAARIPVNTAYAAPLVASNDTCMGSTSAGGQGITFGLSFATTWKDEDCIIRKDARFLHNAQRPDIALSLMCAKKSVYEAVKRAGTREEKIACGIEVEPLKTYLGEGG